MNAELHTQPPPVLPLILLHVAAAAVCFGFFTAVPIGICLICMAIGNDPGGPMFFPIFVLVVLLSAAVITAILAGAALLSDLLRRRHHIPLWVPPLAVFVLATGLTWLLASSVHPAVAPAAGLMITLAFLVHWAAISAARFLARLLFRLLHVQAAPANPGLPPHGRSRGGDF